MKTFIALLALLLGILAVVFIVMGEPVGSLITGSAGANLLRWM